MCVSVFVLKLVNVSSCLQAKAIVTKYLSQEGNKLGSAELNAIGGTNLCSLDVDVLRSISQQSLK